MNMIEQAVKRIEELRRSGIDTPWSANGVDQSAQTTPQPVATEAVTGAADVRQAAPVAPLASGRVPPVAKGDQVAQPADETLKVRRSRQIDLDLKRLSEQGFLVSRHERNLLDDEFRIIKRPLLKNVAGDSAAPIERSNLIMVTSALPGEGKTFTAINLALSMAMELDHTVLLVDSDVIRPSVLNRLNLPAARGLMDVLTGKEKDLADVMLKTNIPKFTILPAGTYTPQSTELLASAAMEDLLTELAELYSDRIVIFDAPPLLPSTESQVLATHMGQILVVVEADRTKRNLVADAFAKLESCPVVMTVLNKSSVKSNESPYGYYAP
jgi:protein-tyrosine kinase